MDAQGDALRVSLAEHLAHAVRPVSPRAAELAASGGVKHTDPATSLRRERDGEQEAVEPRLERDPAGTRSEHVAEDVKPKDEIPFGTST